MLPDKFFEEYKNTGVQPASTSDASTEKEYYTRAEVDQMISERLSEAISQIRDEQVKVESLQNTSEESAEESTTDTSDSE